MSEFPKIIPFGAQAVLFEWNNEISQHTHFEVLSYQQWIEKNCQAEIIETVSAYASLAVYLKVDIETNDWITQFKAVFSKKEVLSKKVKLVHIPVCYDEEFGLDLHEMAAHLKLTTEAIIQKHTSVTYTVYFLGFLPGFPYLGGLDPVLEMSRKVTPRTLVTAGSVGIAGRQTGIYTMDSPGGWNIIGKSPLTFFDATNKKPNLLEAGDSIRFFSVSKSEFDAIKASLNNGSYQLKTETIDA